MEEGNTTNVVPNESLPGDVNVNGDNNSQTQETPAEGQGATNHQSELAVLKERYSHSSQEGKRLAEENKKLEARLSAIEQRSLTNGQAQEAKFPEEDHYVKQWVENGGKTPEEARMEYRNNRALWENQSNIFKYVQAMESRLKFESELREKSTIDQSPDAKHAIEFAEGIPSLERLSTIEKIEAYKKAQSKGYGIKTEGRDLSEVKRAASVSSGGGSGRIQDSPNSHLDAEAKKIGYSSWKAVEEAKYCKTADDFAALKTKYKMK